MKLLELEIRQKTKTEIIETLEPIIGKIIFEKLDNHITIFRRQLTWDLFRLHTLAQNSILNIKLKYYKRNLALLEILSDRQNLPAETTLAFKILREHLDIQHISKHINTYNWYRIYREKRLPNYLLEEIVL